MKSKKKPSKRKTRRALNEATMHLRKVFIHLHNAEFLLSGIVGMADETRLVGEVPDRILQALTSEDPHTMLEEVSVRLQAMIDQVRLAGEQHASGIDHDCPLGKPKEKR